MPEVRVTIPTNIRRQAPFAAALFTSEPLRLTLQLLVDGVRAPFVLEVGGQARPSGPKHELAVDGALDITVRDWGAANVGAQLELLALPPQPSAQGTVIV